MKEFIINSEAKENSFLQEMEKDPSDFLHLKGRKQEKKEVLLV